MKNSKRVLACFLAVTMLLGCFLSIGVTAETTAEPARKNAVSAELTTAYDKLYVQEGLVMLLSAYNQSKAGLVMDDNGMYTGWTDKMNGTVAAFHNYTDANSANNIWWKLRDGKGIGYDLTEVQYRNGSNSNPNAPGIKAYLYLGNGIVDVTKDYTVEYASSLMRISVDGVQQENGGDYYNIASGTEKFGAWGTFVLKLNNAADSLRPTYNKYSLTEKYGERDTPPWNIPVWANDPSVKTSSNVISVDVAQDTSFRDFYANGEHFTWMSIKQNYDQNWKSVITDSAEFWLMQNCANTLYAVRVYDRALTAEEIEWNTFVDIAAYVGADVDALAGISEAQKVSLSAIVEEANLSYTSSKAAVEDVIARSTIYVTEALGYQKSNDGTSLRIWATANLDTIWDADKLGMEIKVTGDAEKVLSGETERVFLSVRSGDKIVCPEAEDTFYFAAIVENIPTDKNFTFVITPYAIVEGAKIYGEAVTLEWPAVE